MHFINPIVSVAIGVTAGGLMQFVFQLPSFFRQGYTFRNQDSRIRSQNTEDRLVTHQLSSSFWHPGLKRIGLLIIPSTVGLAVAQINIFISTILASYLPEGSITYLYYSMRLIQFPVGIFGVAMGMAVLPALSKHSSNGDINMVKEDFSFALRLLFFITIPSMFGLIALNVPIVSTLFQRGKFDYSATIATSDALIFYSIGIWAIVGVRVVTAAFYSMQDTKTPVKIAAAAVMINILLSIIFMGPMKHNGLAFANAIASCFNFMLLFYSLRKRLGGIGAKRIAKSFMKTTAASSIMGLSGWVIAKSDIWLLIGHGIQKAAYLCAIIIICAGIYFTLSFLMKNEEMGYIIDKIRRKK
jgi:putative peptidoglycan lipid II flippase